MSLTLRELVEGGLVVGMVLWLLLIWAQALQRVRARRRIARQRLVCELCLHVWLDDGDAQWQDCPQCGRACERGRDC